jgi:hypothetical protein
MPCYDSRSDDPKYICKDIQTRANEATKAGCEMARLLKDLGYFYRLSSKSRQWARNHWELDMKHKGE